MASTVRSWPRWRPAAAYAPPLGGVAVVAAVQQLGDFFTVSGPLPRDRVHPAWDWGSRMNPVITIATTGKPSSVDNASVKLV